MNKQNRRKNAPRTDDSYLSAKERKFIRQWEELKEPEPVKKKKRVRKSGPVITYKLDDKPQ